jgi:hypothetical protein
LPGAGNGTLIPLTGNGIKVCRVKITNGVNFGSASPDLAWSFTTVPYESRVSVYLNGTSTLLQSNATTHTTHHLVNPVFISLTPPTTASIDNNTLCSSDNGNITLTATGGSGNSLKWYSGSCGSVFVGIGSPLTIPSPTESVTYYARWEMTNSFSTCQSVALQVIPDVSVNVSIAENQNHLCTGMPVTITASLTNGGTTPNIAWYKNSLLTGNTGLTYTYTPTGTDYISCVLTSSITGCTINNPATSNMVTIFVDNPPKASIVKLYLEGLYNPSTGIMNPAMNETGVQFADTVADEVTVVLANTTYPFTPAHTFNLQLLTSGVLNFPVPCSLSGNYYIVVKQRNHIETWSSAPVTFGGTLVEYDFSDDAAKAYGNNMVQMGGIYAIYAGDINQDGVVDGLDMILLDNLSANFGQGYLPEDLNGDGSIDALDMIPLDNNSAAFISVVSP